MSGNAVVALALGLGLGLGIPAIVAMFLARRYGDCGGGTTMHGYHVHGHTHPHGHGLPSRLAILVNVDELRDHLWRILDLDRLTRRLDRHRRAINEQRDDHETLGRAHDELSDRVDDHLSQPHDTAAIAEMLAAERARSDEELNRHKEATARQLEELREQMAKMADHHHDLTLRDIILSTSKRLRALVIAGIAFVVVLLVNFYMPGIQGLFNGTLNLVYHNHSYPIYGLVWDWPRIGVAFAVALVVYTIVNILSAVDNTARTPEHEHTSGPIY